MSRAIRATQAQGDVGPGLQSCLGTYFHAKAQLLCQRGDGQRRVGIDGRFQHRYGGESVWLPLIEHRQEEARSDMV